VHIASRVSHLGGVDDLLVSPMVTDSWRNPRLQPKSAFTFVTPAIPGVSEDVFGPPAQTGSRFGVSV
jgi:hypothetical protein